MNKNSECIENLRKGHKIRICSNPLYSIKRHGALHGYKKTLAGTIQKVKKVNGERIWIVPPRECSYAEISFNIYDLRPIIKEVKVEPELFNTDQLIT